MKKIVWLQTLVLIIILVIIAGGCSNMSLEKKDNSEIVEEINFESYPLGRLKTEEFLTSNINFKKAGLYNRASIIERPDSIDKKCLKIEYPKGTFGPPDNGAQFLLNLAEKDEYYISYWIYIDESFDFRLGGKLPGLTSGGDKYTGGHKPINGDGWSARFMWREDGQLVIYLYYIDMNGKYGENIYLDLPPLKRGKWYRLEEYISLNTEGKENGILKVWVNNKKVLDRNDIRFRLGEKGKIDSFYFSTFHGGNTKDWAPLNDGYILFDNIQIKTKTINKNL